MPRVRVLLSMIGLMAIAACLDVTNPPDSDSQVRVINASGSSLNVVVDGALAVESVNPAAVSAMFMPAGAHQIQFQASNNLTSTLNVTTTSGGVLETYVVQPTTSNLASVVLDTGGIVPFSKSKVRVIHLTKNAGEIDVYRTQPDFQTPTRIQFPFPYMTTTPFVQSDSGYWEVFITPVGSTTKILSTGLFRVEGTGKRTVVFMDSANKTIVRILPE